MPLEELNRIDAAILPRNKTELLWAQDHCRTQMRAAIPIEEKGRWKRLQRDVSRLLRELRVTEDHISASPGACAERLECNHGQKGNQFSEVDGEFSVLGCRHWRCVARGPFTLCLESFLSLPTV